LIERIAPEVEKQAAGFNANTFVAGALDEMCSQGDSVLAGVDLDYGSVP
jgi:hypothetical protein